MTQRTGKPGRVISEEQFFRELHARMRFYMVATLVVSATLVVLLVNADIDDPFLSGMVQGLGYFGAFTAGYYLCRYEGARNALLIYRNRKEND